MSLETHTNGGVPPTQLTALEQEYVNQISALAVENARLRAQLKIAGDTIAQLSQAHRENGAAAITKAARKVIAEDVKAIGRRVRGRPKA